MKDKAEAEEEKPQINAKITTSLLEAFELLRNEKIDSKQNGGAKILSVLQGKESEKDVQYVLKRLVRSLGANVPEKRTGYFATLVALLLNFENVTITELLQLVKHELHASGSSKSEIGDVSLGQILISGAIFRSGLMLRSSEEEQKEVLTLLLTASAKKSYLNTVAYVILQDFVNTLAEDQFSSIIWSNIKKDFKKDLKDHNLDTLYFLTVISKRFPEKVKLRKLIGVSDVLCEDTILTICEKLMAGIDFNSINHPIYKEMAVQVANSPHLQIFWTSGIDSHLKKHNRNRELVALNILIHVLDNIQDNVTVIPELLSRNFFKLLMDWFKGLQTASKIRNKKVVEEDDNKIMIKKGKEFLNMLGKALKSEKVSSEIRVEILKKLLFNPGEMNFTEITGTHIVKSIFGDLDRDGIKKIAKLCKAVLLNTSKKVVKDDIGRNWYNNERLKAAELLSHLVTHETMKDDTNFKLTYMKLLMCFGFFKIGGDETVAISTELSGAIKSSFYRCFSGRFTNVDNLVEVLSALCSFINATTEKEQLKAKLEKQFSKDNMESWVMLTEVCQTIERNATKSKADKVFLILLYQLGLFLFSEPTHVKMANSSIKELKSCYEHYNKGKKKKNRNPKDTSLVGDEPEWLEVLLEVLLSILSTESSVLRSVVQCVFRLLWEDMTPSCIGQIVSVLDPDSESNPLTENSDSEDDESEKESEDDEKGDDKSDEESDESDSGVEDEDVEMKIPDQLRMAVQKALGTAATESDAESIDADMISEEEGKKLDEALAEAFKQFQQGKGKKTKKDRKDKKTLCDFRIRALDLIDIYLEKDPSMDICLGMIGPLTRSLEYCIQDNQFRELENRLRKTLKYLTKIRKFSSTNDVTVSILADYMKSVIERGSRSPFMFQALGDIISLCATFIICCSKKIEVSKNKKGKSVSPLLELVKDSLKSFFHNRNCLLPIIFFHNVMQCEWNGNIELVPIVIENTFSSDVRQFRRNDGVGLLAGFYRFLKRCKPTEDSVLRKLTDTEKAFESALRNLQDKEQVVNKNNFFVILRKLIFTMKNFHESCNVPSSIDFNALLEIVQSSKSSAKARANTQGSPKPKTQNGEVKEKTSKKKKKRKASLTNGNSNVEPKQKKTRQDSNDSGSQSD